MKSTRILSAAFIAAALVGCSQEEQFNMFQDGQTQFSGSFEQVNSRVTMDTENYMMHWEEDCSDLVSIFPGITVNNKYQVSGINNGKASFAFVDYYFPDGATYSKLNSKLNYALYPYADGNEITADGTITAQLPAELTYVSHENSIKTALMAAKSEGNDLSFKNVQGILRLRLDAELPFFKVKSITLKSTKSLSGEATIVFDEDLPKVTLDEDGGKTLTINLSENLQQCLKGTTSGEYSEFYIPVVPALYAQGELQMIIDWVDQDVADYVHPIRIPVNIERRKIYTLYITVPANGFGGDLEGADEVWDGETVTVPSPVTDTTTGEEYYPVTKASDLAGLAAMINGTSTYSSRAAVSAINIKLESDIDLGGFEWTPIGSMTQEHGFTGNFDGNGHTIKNLKISQIALDSDGYAYAGLFGLTEGAEDNENYIKNLTIENVDITTEGHIVAAAIAYPYYTTVENITVKGNINIKGGDYTAGVLAYTRRCVNAKDLTIVGNAGSSIEGKSTVGGVISDIQMNGGLTANYSNFAASGLTINGTKCVGGISGIISQQKLDGATVKNVTIVCGDNRTGVVSGADGGNSTIENVSYENVTGATRIIGATYDKGYYVGQMVEAAGQKAIIYSIEDGVKAVSVGEITLKGKYWQDAMDWAAALGEGWALASMEDLNAIYDIRVELNKALKEDNAQNALFWEGDELYINNGSIYYANYMSSTEVPYGQADANGNAYFENRVFFKQFNAKGYSDVLYSAFDCINKYAPLRDNHFARAVYTF